MVFRIRDKSLFWTKSGWKNNWEPKILNMPKPINTVNTQYVTCRFDHHSYLRSTHSTTQSSKHIETSREQSNSIFTETLPSNNSSFCNSEISSSFHITAKLQSNSSRTEPYFYFYSGKEICRSN